MGKLTREEKLQLCIKAKEMYERNKGKMGLCEVFTKCYNRSIRLEDWIGQQEISEILPEFFEYKPLFKAKTEFWWATNNYRKRERVLTLMIKRFS